MRRETIIFDGKEWYRYPDSEKRSDRVYFKKSNKFLHHYVWEKYKGKRRKGYHIHHIDGNTSNNAIDNLEELSVKEHMQEHFSDERREWQREWAAKIRSLTKDWHSSEEGRKWHSEHARNTRFGIFTFGICKCEVCGSEFTKRTTNQKFCSNKCKSQYRRNKGFDNVTRICEECGKEFIINKYSRTKFCSRSCTNRYVWRNSRRSI